MPENPPRGREKLPAFQTMEECRAYCDEQGDNFYFTAFMLEVWIGTIVTKTVEQYAEHKSGDRHLQSGTGWEAWQSVFGHAQPEEWGHILDALGRFSQCDTPEAEMVGKVLALLTLEDKYGVAVSLSAAIAQKEGGKVTFSEMVERMRYVFQRISEWMEAIVHWDMHAMAAAVPISFRGTEEQRELATLGIMQRFYAELREHGKDWWRFRHEELATQFQGKADWRIVGKAQSFEKCGTLLRPDLDELTILWWPLLTRHCWTDHDMRCLLQGVLPKPDVYPLREDKEFADYRKKALGLIKGKEKRDKSTADGKPTGWRVAMAMIGKLSE